MPTKRKMFIFKDFGHKFTIFKEQAFSEHLLPTACEYSMFLPLTKIKNKNIKVISDKKSLLNLKSKSKLVKL